MLGDERIGSRRPGPRRSVQASDPDSIVTDARVRQSSADGDAASSCGLLKASARGEIRQVPGCPIEGYGARNAIERCQLRQRIVEGLQHKQLAFVERLSARPSQLAQRACKRAAPMRERCTRLPQHICKTPERLGQVCIGALGAERSIQCLDEMLQRDFRWRDLAPSRIDACAMCNRLETAAEKG